MPLPHRCELIRELDGVEWINDSKGTNLGCGGKGAASETRPVILIAGGKDKGFGYEPLTELVAQKCRAVVVLGEMADRIERLWNDRLPVRNAGVLAGVRRQRRPETPGAARRRRPVQPGHFFVRHVSKTTRERGDQFRELVQALSPNNP